MQNPFRAVVDWLNATDIVESSNLQESVLGGMELIDPDAGLSATQGGSAYYRRLSAGKRDLTPIVTEKVQQLAFGLYEASPIAKRAVDMVADFAVGDGILPVATMGDDETAHDQIQGVIDRFWMDPLNRMDLKLHSKVRDLGLFGEQVWPVFVNPTDGHVRLGLIDPESIKQIVTDPQNVEVVREIILKNATGTDDIKLKAVSLDEDPKSATFGRWVGLREGEQIDEGGDYLAAAFYFAVNKISTAKRGRTDLLSVIDWIDSLDQMLFGEVDRGLLMKVFVWDVLLEGMSDVEIAEYLKVHGGVPKPGSIRAHNERVKWEAVTPDLKSVDASVGADLILSYIATGLGLPKHWLNGSMDVNRASAQEMAEPTIRHLAQRQAYVKYIVETVLCFVLDQAENVGMVDKRQTVAGSIRPEPWPFTVQAPEFRPKDLSANSQSLVSAANALATMRADGVIDVEVEQQVMVTLLAQIGVDVDLTALRERIAVADAEKADQEPAVPFGGADAGADGDALDIMAQVKAALGGGKAA